jgi:hypothetical protein
VTVGTVKLRANVAGASYPIQNQWPPWLAAALPSTGILTVADFNRG